MSRFPDQNAELTEVFVIAKSINSLGQFEASLGRTYVALLGPLVDSDNVFLSMS